MTYEEFLRNWFVEKNGGGEYYDTYSTEENSPWKVGWTRTEIVHDEEEHTWIEPITDSEGYYWLTKEADGVKVSVGIEDGEYGDITKISIEADGVDVSGEEIGTIDAVDALLGTGLDAASKKAEELKKRKLVTVANLQKALEDYDERKGTAVEDGEPVEGKNKVFIDGSGRVYARRTELARQDSLNSEKSDRQSADNRLSDEIAKKADKEHTHKTADITDLPNYARSVNGEEPDADGNVEIDIDAVEEVAELPAETEKKVYLVPEKEEQSVSVDCSSVESIMAAIADWLSGEGGHSFSAPDEFLEFLRGLETDKGKKIAPDRDLVKIYFFDNKDVVVNGESVPAIHFGKYDFGSSYYVIDEHLNIVITSYMKNKKQDMILWIFQLGDLLSFSWGYGLAEDGSEHNTGWRTMRSEGAKYIMSSTVTLPSSISLIDRRTPLAVYAKSVELATKEALSEATSGADEKAAALGERIGAVESSVTTAKSDITAMKSDITTAKTNITAMKSNITEAQANITEAQANITKAQSDITKAQGDIEAVTSEVETVKNDVAALGTKAVRSVNGTEPDENGNVEVAVSSDASDKNDTITVSDADSAVSDDTGILSGKSVENPKGLLRFAASKLWEYVQGKIAEVLGIKVTSYGGTEFLGGFEYFGEKISFPFVKQGSFAVSGDKNCRAIKTVNFAKEMPTNNYILDFGEASPDPSQVVSVKVCEKKSTGFKVDIETSAEGEKSFINYIAVAFR